MGSSSSSRSRSATSRRASSTRRRSPPDRSPSRRSSRASSNPPSRPTSTSRTRASTAHSCVARLPTTASRIVVCRVEGRVLPQQPRWASDARLTRPASTGSSPAMTASSVLLPAPFRPTTPIRSPAPTPVETPAEQRALAEGLAHGLEVDEVADGGHGIIVSAARRDREALSSAPTGPYLTLGGGPVAPEVHQSAPAGSAPATPAPPVPSLGNGLTAPIRPGDYPDLLEAPPRADQPPPDPDFYVDWDGVRTRVADAALRAAGARRPGQHAAADPR